MFKIWALHGKQFDASGGDICLLSEKEAQEWAEMYLPVDTYERYFGVIEE